MKNSPIIAVLAAALLLAGCSRETEKFEDTSSSIVDREKILTADTDARHLIEYHRKYKGGKLLYPESYAGYYIEGETIIVLLTDIGTASEYDYLIDSYADTAFKEVEYSYNYLQSLIDEYENSDEYEKTESCHVDVKLNRAVVEVDKEKLAEKQSDEDSPLIFKEKSKIYVL